METQESKTEKHPDVIAWEEWRNSEEGYRCIDTPCGGIYLENRLWRAFMAGRRNLD